MTVGAGIVSAPPPRHVHTVATVMVLPIICQNQEKQTLSVTHSGFSLSEMEVTGNLMAKNTLLISQPPPPAPPYVVCSRRLPREQRSELSSCLMRAVVGGVRPLPKQNPR